MIKSVYEIRRENFRQVLADQGGSQAELAKRLHKSPKQVGAWLGKVGKQKPPDMQEDTARNIEEALGLNRYWMDIDHAAVSQSMGLDTGRLALMIECMEGALLDSKRELEPGRKARILTLLYADAGIGNTREAVQAALRVAFMAMG